MSIKLNKYRISAEIYKFPYSATISTENLLSDKICLNIIKTRKRAVRKAKRVFVYVNLTFTLTTSSLPAHVNVIQNITLPMFTSTPSLTKVIDVETELSRSFLIAQFKASLPPEMAVQDEEINLSYDLAVRYKNQELTREQVVETIVKLRGGADERLMALVAVGAIFLMVYSHYYCLNANAFPVQYRYPPMLNLFHDTNYKPGMCGYKGSGSFTVRDLTRNAGSDKKDPSSGSYEYKDIIIKLDKQSGKSRVEVQVGNQWYTVKNPSRKPADELSDDLAEKIYNSIRECDTDICDIAANLGFKADNVKNVKDHIFYNEHDLDRYGPDEIEHKRFDATLQQALAWKRLEAGIHTQDDVTWIKHECAERHHELKYDSGYSEAHERAQSRYDGYPWKNKF